MRGGERVLETFCELYPEADIFTLLHVRSSVSDTIEKRDIKTSFIQKLPKAGEKYRLYLPLFPMAIESFDLTGYDLVISSSHCVAKGVVPGPSAVHVSYIYTPMRYIWDQYHSYFNSRRNGWLGRKAIGAFTHYLRFWDASSSSRVDSFVAISEYVAKRVRKYYRRDASVIYPPVDCKRFKASKKEGDYFLMVSAFAPYKRIDLAIAAFNYLKLPLKIIGKGEDEERLRAIAGKNIEFLGWRSDSDIAEHYANCKAFVFPGAEDFGITPLEAMASGKPVIAFGMGGALETVVPLDAKEKGQTPTGVFFNEASPESLIEAIKAFDANKNGFDPIAIREHALRFDKSVFKEKMRSFIEEQCAELN